MELLPRDELFRAILASGSEPYRTNLALYRAKTNYFALHRTRSRNYKLLNDDKLFPAM